MTSRGLYRHSLDDQWGLLAELAALDVPVIEQASRALLDVDPVAAESVINDYEAMEELHREIDARAFDLVAMQAPVATDLRLVIASIPMAAALTRMGGLARHIAQTALRRVPEAAVVPELREVFGSMSQTAIEMASELAAAIAERDPARALALGARDEAIDVRHQEMFRILLAPTWSHGIEAAVDASLLGRFFERFADQAVNAGRRVEYIVVGR
jgi:phosphate transport system protein